MCVRCGAVWCVCVFVIHYPSSGFKQKRMGYDLLKNSFELRTSPVFCFLRVVLVREFVPCTRNVHDNLQRTSIHILPSVYVVCLNSKSINKLIGIVLLWFMSNGTGEYDYIILYKLNIYDVAITTIWQNNVLRVYFI